MKSQSELSFILQYAINHGDGYLIYYINLRIVLVIFLLLKKWKNTRKSIEKVEKILENPLKKWKKY